MTACVIRNHDGLILGGIQTTEQSTRYYLILHYPNMFTNTVALPYSHHRDHRNFWQNDDYEEQTVMFIKRLGPPRGVTIQRIYIVCEGDYKGVRLYWKAEHCNVFQSTFSYVICRRLAITCGVLFNILYMILCWVKRHICNCYDFLFVLIYFRGQHVLINN